MPETRSIGEILRDAEAGRLDRVFAEDREPYDFIGTTERLFDLLDERGVDYAIVGGMALHQHAEIRNSGNIDLILDPAAHAYLSEIRVVDAQPTHLLTACFGRIEVRLLSREEPVFNLVSDAFSGVIESGGRPLKFGTPQGLALLLSYALSDPLCWRKDIQAMSDLVVLSFAHAFDSDSLLRAVASHVSAVRLATMEAVLDDVTVRIRRHHERRLMFLAS